MAGPITPETYVLDVNGANGTPFRFVFYPGEDGGTVRYHDRRYTLAKGELGYGINQTNEHGQACGPKFTVSAFVPPRRSGLLGWHDVGAWDVDVATCHLVTAWLTALGIKGV